MAKNVKTIKTVKAKSTKAASKPRAKRSTRPNVISFRISDTQQKTLDEIFNRDVAVGVKSSDQLARKIVCDYLAGRLEYRNAEDKLQDLDVVGA